MLPRRPGPSKLHSSRIGKACSRSLCSPGLLLIFPGTARLTNSRAASCLLKLGKIQKRIRENHKIDLNCSDALIEEIGRRCTEVESGARNVDNIVTNTLLPEISRQLLTRIAEGQKLESIRADVGADGNFVYS